MLCVVWVLHELEDLGVGRVGNAEVLRPLVCPGTRAILDKGRGRFAFVRLAGTNPKRRRTLAHERIYLQTLPRGPTSDGATVPAPLVDPSTLGLLGGGGVASLCDIWDICADRLLQRKL